jgi:hypothetical protein
MKSGDSPVDLKFGEPDDSSTTFPTRRFRGIHGILGGFGKLQEFGTGNGAQD